jgi:hypothetical protein
MGSKVYDYLSESLLFDDSLILDQFRSIPEDEILKELRRYREFCLSAMGELEQEALSNTSNLKLFSGINLVSPALLKQSAFYVEQHILYDPLFALTEESNQNDQALDSLLGLKRSPFDKLWLSKMVNYLKSLTPMVAANYVKLLPTSYFFEPPEQIPYRHSATGFADVLPEPLMKFFRDNAIVQPFEIVDGKIRVGGKLEIGRDIYILFQEHGMMDARGYTLAKEYIKSKNEETRTVESIIFATEEPPDQATFEGWVFQSINQTAEHLYKRIVLENTFAAKFGASYLSNSPFVFRLLEQIVPIEGNIQTNTANALMNVELPFLDEVDVETLMKVRQEEGEAFQSFRLELDKQLRDLRLVKDPETLKIKAENVVHELSEVQVHQLDQKLAYLKKRFFASASVATASFMGALQTGGLTLPVALIAAFKGYETQAEYQRQKRENPAFFLWKVLKGSR